MWTRGTPQRANANLEWIERLPSPARNFWKRLSAFLQRRAKLVLPQHFNTTLCRSPQAEVLIGIQKNRNVAQ